MTEIFGLDTLVLDPALGVMPLKIVVLAANAMLGKLSASTTIATNAPIPAVRRSDPWPLPIAALPTSHIAREQRSAHPDRSIYHGSTTPPARARQNTCLLYTSDAADE